MGTAPHGPKAGPFWEANLAALAVRQPELAQRLAALPLPSGYRVAVGRDGQPVGVVEENQDQICWLGGSSMPSVSVPEVLAGFSDRGVNVALASVGTGREPAALVARLAPHLALFVCELHPERAVLALGVADWSEPLRAGRIVLATGDVPEELARFLAHHGGYLFPAQLYVPPPLERAEGEAYAAALERAAVRAESVYESALRAFDEAPARATAGSPRSGPFRLLILSADPHPLIADWAASLEAAARALGGAPARCTPDGPERASLLARLSAARTHQPELIVTLNGTLEPRRGRWPEGVRTAAWFLVPGRGIPPAEQLPGTCCLAASRAIADELVARGATPQQVHVLGPGVDDVACTAESDAFDASRPVQALLDGILFDPSAGAAGIGLESHQRLWDEIAKAVATAAARGEDLSIEAMLETAQRRCGVTLQDRESRRRFGALAETRLVPSAAARAAAAAVARLPNIVCLGPGWEAPARTWPGTSAGRAALLRQARWLILPNVDETAIRRAAEALLCGTLVAWRAPGAGLLDGEPGQVMKEIPSYRRPAELAGLLARPAQAAERCRTIAETLRARHSWRVRFEALLGILQGKQPGGDLSPGSGR